MGQEHSLPVGDREHVCSWRYDVLDLTMHGDDPVVEAYYSCSCGGHRMVRLPPNLVARTMLDTAESL